MKKILLLAVLLLPVSLSAQSVSLSWDASPTPGVTYNLYRAKLAGGCPAGSLPAGCTKVNSAPLTLLSFSDTVGSSGRWFYVVRAVDVDGVESVNSNELMVTLPPSPPANLRKN